MAEVLGSAVKHQPFDAANTAANAIGAAIGTGIGSTFAERLDAKYKDAGQHVEYTKQARKQSASQRPQTAVEQHMPGAKPTAKPKAKTRIYDPYEDPEIYNAELMAENAKTQHVNLGNYDYRANDDLGYRKQQAAYNSTAGQRENWKVDHSTLGEINRAVHDHYSSMGDMFSDPYNNVIKPMAQNWYQGLTKTNEYTKVSSILGAAYNYATQPLNQFSNMMDASVGFINQIATGENRAYNLTLLGVNLAENLLTDGAIGAIKTGVIAAKIGMFSKTAAAVKVATASKGVALSGMFARTAETDNIITRAEYLHQTYGHYTREQRIARIAELSMGNKVLRESGMPRKFISQALQSFEPGTIKVEVAGENTYGIRFFGGASRPEGAYLNPTFPLGNVMELNALPPANSISSVMQWQIRPESRFLSGRVRSLFGQPGGATQFYVPNFKEDLLQPKW